MNHPIAEVLLKIKAVHLNPKNPFTWTSGIKSPIYCDNRQLMSYPKVRDLVIETYLKEIDQSCDVLAGTATAGIPWASILADRLQKPLVYIRSEAKGHGLKNAIEGKLIPLQKVLVIEDLISTGKSSLKAARDVTEAEGIVIGIHSIFTYDFIIQPQNFPLKSLCHLDQLLQTALNLNIIDPQEKEDILKWKSSVSTT